MEEATLTTLPLLPEPRAVLVQVLVALLLVSVALFFWHAKQQQSERESSTSKKLKRRMSNIGLTTLVTESATNLSIPVSVLTLGGRLSRDEIVERLQTRMTSDPFFSRFRSLVVGSPWTFVEVEDYNVGKNITEHVLGPQETTMSYVETLVNTPLDFSKPLWELCVIQENEEGSGPTTQLAWKIHHCIGDGASLSMAMVRLSDNVGQFDAMIAKMQEVKKSQPKKPAPTPKERLQTLGGLVLLVLWSSVVIGRKFAALLFRLEPATMFKKRGGTTKRLSSHLAYSVTTTKAVGKKFHATINDVMLTCVAGAMRRAMLANGETISPSLTVRAAIPVDMRATTEVITTARNKFSSLVIDFPVGVTDPVKRLKLVKASMSEAKNSLEKVFTYTGSNLVAQLPVNIMKKIVRFSTSKISVAITNVRASSFELSICSHKMLGFFGFVPPPPSVNLGIAILSAGDELGLNVLVDPTVGLDPKQFLEFCQQEYEELKQKAESPESKKEQ